LIKCKAVCLGLQQALALVAQAHTNHHQNLQIHFGEECLEDFVNYLPKPCFYIEKEEDSYGLEQQVN